MCGTLQLSASEKLLVKSGNPMHRALFTPMLKYDLPVSSQRFIRIENSKWWKKTVQILDTKPLLRVLGFFEKGIYFEIPKGYRIRCVIHKDVVTFQWVVSILTIDTATPCSDPIVEDLRLKVYPIHNRMPVLQRVA